MLNLKDLKWILKVYVMAASKNHQSLFEYEDRAFLGGKWVWNRDFFGPTPFLPLLGDSQRLPLSPDEILSFVCVPA